MMHSTSVSCSSGSPVRQYIVQSDMHAHPIDSGTAASSPTLLYALGSVSMIWPTCNVKTYRNSLIYRGTAAANMHASIQVHTARPLQCAHPVIPVGCGVVGMAAAQPAIPMPAVELNLTYAMYVMCKLTLTIMQ
jgi:hypothetical protein